MQPVPKLFVTQSQRPADLDQRLEGTAPRRVQSQTSSILVVDDESMIRGLLAESLGKHGFDCVAAGSGEEAIQYLNSRPFALLIADVCMPGLSGLQLLDFVVANCPDVAVIMITAVADLQTAVASMKRGACDYITKPFRLEQVVSSVRQALRERNLRLRDVQIRKNLQMLVTRRTFALDSALKTLESQRGITLEALVRALHAREHETYNHCLRVQAYSVRLGQQMGLEEEVLTTLSQGALLHDVGKIGVPDSILLKPGPLTPDEWEAIKRHPVIGYEIVQGVDFLEKASELILYHHERLDGSGYPRGLKRKEVPLLARLFAIVDTYDAITSDRPFRKARSAEAAKKELVKCQGSLLDPEIVGHFLAIPEADLAKIRSSHP